MAAACPLGDPFCVFNSQTQRHTHRADLLNLIGQPCWCKRNDWFVIFGGLLPARVLCGGCGEGFNIGQRLRDCGKPSIDVRRSNR